MGLDLTMHQEFHTLILLMEDIFQDLMVIKDSSGVFFVFKKRCTEVLKYDKMKIGFIYNLIRQYLFIVCDIFILVIL